MPLRSMQELCHHRFADRKVALLRPTAINQLLEVLALRSQALQPFLALQVLHIDRNNYYGGESASLNLNQVLGCILIHMHC